jgi:hypothetical protein
LRILELWRSLRGAVSVVREVRSVLGPLLPRFSAAAAACSVREVCSVLRPLLPRFSAAAAAACSAVDSLPLLLQWVAVPAAPDWASLVLVPG